MSDKISTAVFQQIEGAVGECFVPFTCDSCNSQGVRGVEILAGTKLGDLLQLDPNGMEIETGAGAIEERPEVATVCPECLEHLLVAKDE